MSAVVAAVGAQTDRPKLGHREMDALGSCSSRVPCDSKASPEHFQEIKMYLKRPHSWVKEQTVGERGRIRGAPSATCGCQREGAAEKCIGQANE